MKVQLLTLTLLFISSIASSAEPIVCVTESTNTVVVEMMVPHPKEALVHRPTGRTVWLQADEELAHEQMQNFEFLDEWEITSTTLGTVFIDGMPRAEPIMKKKRAVPSVYRGK